jgi:hypothetical protein
MPCLKTLDTLLAAHRFNDELGDDRRDRCATRRFLARRAASSCSSAILSAKSSSATRHLRAAFSATTSSYLSGKVSTIITPLFNTICQGILPARRFAEYRLHR